jgi:hypothetical protein
LALPTLGFALVCGAVASTALLAPRPPKHSAAPETDWRADTARASGAAGKRTASERQLPQATLPVAAADATHGTRTANEIAETLPTNPRGAASGEPGASESPATRVSAAPTSDYAREPTPIADGPAFTSQPERELIAQLRSEALLSARKGRGGRSLAFKITLASGIQGYFKPEQSVSSAHWYAEVAAYHLDRALGLGRVPPVTGRRLDWKALLPAAGNDRRIPEVSVAKDGTVRGALVAWLNEPLLPASTPPGWENWVRAEAFPRDAVSPYQRPTVFGAALGRAHQQRLQGLPPELHYQTTPAIPQPELPAALSDMIIFDFLTLNYDRFGGDNVNVLTRGARGPLIFLDNGDGFSAGTIRRHLCDVRLAPLSRFRRRTIEALRAFDIRAFEARLASEPLAPILDAAALAGLAARRTIVLEHVAAQQRRYGDVVYAW